MKQSSGFRTRSSKFRAGSRKNKRLKIVKPFASDKKGKA